MKCPHCGETIDLQSKGGHARAAKLTDKRRSEIASKASQARWGKRTVPVPASGQSEGNRTGKPSRKGRQ